MSADVIAADEDADVYDAAREWLEDCEFPDLPDIDDLTDRQVRAAVDRHYDGGWYSFDGGRPAGESFGERPVTERAAHLLAGVLTTVCLFVAAAQGSWL